MGSHGPVALRSVITVNSWLRMVSLPSTFVNTDFSIEVLFIVLKTGRGMSSDTKIHTADVTSLSKLFK